MKHPTNLFTRACLQTLLLSSLLFSSCKGIDENERLIFVQPPQVKRAVLIEDFTGQRCINCPNAALEIEKLKEQYGETNIIAVGIHSGPLAVYSRGAVVGLRTEEGDAYYEHWGITQEPMGYINRQGAISTVDRWATLVRNVLQTSSDMTLTLEAFCDSLERKVDFVLQVTNGVPVDGHVQLWLTENDIPALQMMPDGSANTNYVHQHVFRKSVNGQWGDPYHAEAGDVDYLDYSCSIDEAWKPENMSVVAFVYNETGVLQVVEAPLVFIE